MLEMVDFYWFTAFLLLPLSKAEEEEEK